MEKKKHKQIKKFLLLIAAKPNILVGGQAVIEGVMMRVPGAYATAVRNPRGIIETDRSEFQSVTERKPELKKPVLRGVIGLFEALKIGMKTLQWSADVAMPEESEKPKTKLLEGLTTAFAVALALGLFFAAPIGLTTWLFDRDNDPFTFNLISGIFRIVFFLVYLLIISLLKDVRRLFQYHGAEHKTVFTFETGKLLTVENTREFSTFHPRCGTSFLFIIMLVAILTFAVIDSVLVFFVGDIRVWMRLVLHLPLIPLVAGVGYEVLKLTASHRDKAFFRMLSAPGLWLQRITTKPPDDEQLEVAVESLKTAFGEKLAEYEGQTFTAEAIG